MLLWSMFAVLTTAVLMVVLRPVMGGGARVPEYGPAADVAVYTDQLADLEHQVARGQLDPSESAALRHEISRRILRASPIAAPLPTSDAATAKPLVAAAALLVPVLCLGIYLSLGSPGVASRPFQPEVVSPATASAAELIAKVEARLAANPDDARGWDVIAPVYFRLERYAEAADAYGHALRISGDTTQRLAGFAEATVLANDGIVAEPARRAYQKLRVANPERFEPRFWLAFALEQDGKRDAAASEYRSMLASAPPDVQWRSMVEQRLAAVSKSAALTPPGPSQAEVTAAAAMSEAERSAMIDSMVEGLATRLRANGQDLEGWQRLIQAYVTLKKSDRARAALADARQALLGNVSALSALDDLARRLAVTP